MPIISAIAVISKNRAMGKDNGLIFHVPGDLARFKKITTGHPIIMGRKTFESKEINKKPLPNRMNIVVTKNINYKGDGIAICSSVDEAIKMAQEQDDKEIFIIGGGQIYQELWSKIEKLYLTVVDVKTKGDTYFPDFSDFSKVVFEEKHEAEGLNYSYIELKR